MKICSVCQRCYDDDAKFCVQKSHNRLVAARPGIREAIEGYRLDFLIQRDAAVETYEASQIETNKSVLIRFISPQFYFDTLNLRESFLHEAQKAAALHHPHIVDVYESGVLENGELFTVTDNVDGQNLRQYFDERDSFSENDAIIIVRQIADALEAAHRVGVAHRAVNPANVIITFDEENRLTAKLYNFDFGGATEQIVISDEWFPDCNEQWRLEMFKYFSPEQCAREAVDVRSDIYSLGVLFYELLSGSPPFEDATAKGLADKQINAQPLEIENLRFDIKELLNHTLSLALKKSQFARPQTVARFAHSLVHVEHITTQSLSPLEKFLQTVKEDSKPLAPQKTQPTAPLFNDFAAEKPQETLSSERESRKAAAPTGRLFATAFSTQESAVDDVVKDDADAPQEIKETVVNPIDNFRFAAPETTSPVTPEPPVPPIQETVYEETAESPAFIEHAEYNSSDDEVFVEPDRNRNVLAGFEAHGSPRSRFPAVAVGLAAMLILAVVGALFSPWLFQNVGNANANAELLTGEPVAETEANPLPTNTAPSNKSTTKAGKQTTSSKQETQSVKETTESPKQPRSKEKTQSETKNNFRFNGKITPEAQAELSSSLDGWMQATNDGDVNKQMNFYAPRLNAYYLTRNATPNVVRAEKKRIFAQAEDINIKAAKPDIEISRDGRNAKMRFRKKYAFKNGRQTRQGEVLQELHWVKSGKGWKIVSERDLRVLNQ